MKQLTSPQWDELIDQYVTLQIDSMDHKDMYQFVYNQLVHELGEIESRQELCDDIKYSFDEDTLNELIDNVTNPTVLDVNQTGGKY
tara:strand:+ start:184 stop:441 length:258 start_codon:yes stop_codon:yes gene_type:complete